MQFLAREKRGGLAACLLGICVIGEGGVVALSEADLVIRLSRARLGVLRLGHVVACIRITSHELLRDGVCAAAAFLLRRPHRAGFLSGSFSSFPHIWLASLIQQKKRANSAPGAAPGGGQGTDWVPGQPSPPSGSHPGLGGCQRQRTRPKGAYAERTRARRGLKTSVRQCMAFRCAYVKFLAPERCGG